MSWLRNGAPQFRAPAKTFQTMHHSLSLHHFPLSLVCKWDGEENWRHKSQRSQVAVRTIYWKRQWNKKMSGDSNNINDRKYNKRNYSHGRKNPSNRQYQQASATFFFTSRNVFSSEESLFPLLPAMTWGDMEYTPPYVPAMPSPSYCKKLTLSWPEPEQHNSKECLWFHPLLLTFFRVQLCCTLYFIFLWTSMGLKAPWGLVEIRIFQLCQDLM